MQKLTIPGTSLHASRIGMGTSEWGSAQSIEEANVIFESYLSAGGNVLDSAHCYAFWKPGGPGQSERTVGELVRRHRVRDQMIICTKGGTCDSGPPYPRPPQCLRADLIRGDVDDSLQRLGFEQIDLYFLHRDDGITPVAEVMQTLNDLIAMGKLRYIAASNWSTRRMEEANTHAAAHGLHGFCASQVQWSLATPDWKVEEDPVMRHVNHADRAWYIQHQMPIFAYSSTAGGFFAGADPKGGVFNTADNHQRLHRAEELAKTLGCTPNQVAMAWLIHQPVPVIPLTSTRRSQHLLESIQATRIQLAPPQIQWLEEGSAVL